MSLTGWQAIAALLIAGGLAVAGAFVPSPTAGVALFNLATGIVTGTFALLQGRRDPNARTRSSDRTITSAQGISAYDPHKTPREGTQPMPPGARRP